MSKATRVLILGGGRGTRLWPLTDDDVRPKPCVYVGGPKRLLEYIFDIMARADLYKPYVAVQHMETNITRAFRDGSDFVYDIDDEKTPLEITYTRSPPDKQFRGTADALRKSRVYLADNVVVANRETGEESKVDPQTYLTNKRTLRFKSFVENFDNVVVCNGDILTNFDISYLLHLHRERGARATIAAYKMEDISRIPGQLGTMLLDAKGNLAAIDEKPRTVEDVKSDIINPGIYVFDRSVLSWLDTHDDISDFASHMFPEMLRQGFEIFAPVMHGYWNDLGTIENYRATNLHLIDGIKGVDTRSHIRRGQEASRVLGDFHHSMIASGCLIESGSSISNSVLSNDITVNPGVMLEDCIVNSGCEIGADCKAAIIDSDVIIEHGARLGEKVVIGKGTHVKAGALVHPGVKIGPGQMISGEVKEDIGMNE